MADRFLAGARQAEGQISPQVASIADNIDGARMQGYPDNAPDPAGPGSWPYPHPDNPLSHAEVRAVNELLWRRGVNVGPDVFHELRVDNYFPFKLRAFDRRHAVRTAPHC